MFSFVFVPGEMLFKRCWTSGGFSMRAFGEAPQIQAKTDEFLRLRICQFILLRQKRWNILQTWFVFGCFFVDPSGSRPLLWKHQTLLVTPLGPPNRWFWHPMTSQGVLGIFSFDISCTCACEHWCSGSGWLLLQGAAIAGSYHAQVHAALMMKKMNQVWNLGWLIPGVLLLVVLLGIQSRSMFKHLFCSKHPFLTCNLLTEHYCSKSCFP